MEKLDIINNAKVRDSLIIVLTFVLILSVSFLLSTSKDVHWGSDIWEQWLIKYFKISIDLAYIIVFWLRKSIHFFAYGTLSILFCLYFFLCRFKKAIWLGLGATIIVAILDEYLQSFTTYRTGKVADVLLDILGMLSFIMIILWYKNKKQSNKY